MDDSPKVPPAASGNIWERLNSGIPPDVVRFDYIKSNFFRVVHADGVWLSQGGQNLHLSFFNERVPIPQQTLHSVRKDGQLGDESVKDRIGRDAIVREIDVDVVMNLETGRAVRDILDRAIKAIEANIARQKVT